MKRFGHIKLPGFQTIQRLLFYPFYAGTTLQESESTVASLSNYGVYSYLNYAIEDSSTESEFDTNCEMVQNLIIHAAKTNNIPFSVCKPTSFGHKHLFQKINAKHSLNQKNKSLGKESLIDFVAVAKPRNMGLLC